MNNFDTWQYKIVSSLQTFNMDETLVRLGAEGWEAVNMIIDSNNQLSILFKRKINE